MTDLTKLTAEEFSRRIDNCDWDMEERIENERRLERLEECEETLRKSQRIEKEGIAAIASAAAAERRLEKCEYALNTIMSQLPTCGHETQAEYQSFCLSCVIRKLARAALDE